MYSYYVDFHEGAVRITVKARASWLRKCLTGQVEYTIAETYMARGSAVQLGSKILRVCNGLARIKRGDDAGD